MLAEPLQATVVLSSGSTWNPPSILPLPGDTWPAGSTTYTVFYDTAGATLATVNGTVTDYAVDYTVSHTAVDGVPAGSNFETFVITPDTNAHKIRYGKVVRKEVTFSTAPGSQVSTPALQYSDTLQRTALGANWIPVAGGTTIFNNSGASLPDAMAVSTVALAKSAVRWFTPLNSDSVSVQVTVLNPGPGLTGVVLCSDALMTSYLAVVFETGVSNNYIHLATGTGPNTLIYQETITHTTANNDNYICVYNHLTSTLSVYQGTETTPLVSWTDFNGLVPHGPGYRYVGFNFASSLLSSGVQISGWQAQDQIVVAPQPSGPLQFTDNLQRATVGPNWIPVSGSSAIFTNGSLPDGLAVSSVAFAKSALLYATPLNTDNVSVQVTVLNPGAGYTGVVLCSDNLMTNYLAVAWETGVSNNYIHLCTGSAPNTMTAQQTVSHTTANNDSYICTYNNLTSTLSVYQGTSTSPLVSWTDTGALSHHGAGQRYTGFNFASSLASSGVQISGWQAQDKL